MNQYASMHNFTCVFFYISCVIKYTYEKRKNLFKKMEFSIWSRVLLFLAYLYKVLCTHYIPILKLKLCRRVEAHADCWVSNVIYHSKVITCVASELVLFCLHITRNVLCFVCVQVTWAGWSDRCVRMPVVLYNVFCPRCLLWTRM
jgi:hypothetical protein